MYWLGIDIGTGGSRALLVNEKGRVTAAVTAAHEDIKMERPLWAEQRPENWWDAAQQAIREVLKTIEGQAEQHQGRRAFRPDARPRDPRRKQLRDSTRPDLVRSAQPESGRRHQSNRRQRQRARLHGESSADRFHAAETAMGSRQQARQLQTHRQDAAPERLHPLHAHRRVRFGCLRCFRDRALRCGHAAVVQRDGYASQTESRDPAGGLRIERHHRHDQ